MDELLHRAHHTWWYPGVSGRVQDCGDGGPSFDVKGLARKLLCHLRLFRSHPKIGVIFIFFSAIY
jgi:hypothetical protein